MELQTTNAAYTTRTTCRLCGGDLKDVLSLGPIHISTFSATSDTQSPKVPIDLMECVACGIMQLRNTVSGAAMYSTYWYRSGLNGDMVRALNNVVTETLARVNISAGDIIVDIGTNDGTLLEQYPQWVREKCWLMGYEPSNLAKLAEGKGHYIINDYFNAAAYTKIFTKKAKVITSIAMFYDLEEPHVFIEDVRNILDEQGVWTIQLMDLLSMVRSNDFPNLCAEHLEYYKLSDLALLFAQHRLKIIDVEYNAVNGSSLRVYVSHQNAGYATDQRYYDALTAEHDFFAELGDISTYFKNAVENVRSGIVSYLTYLKDTGKTVALFAASTKTNTALEYFGIGSEMIDHASEVNPDKYGKYTTTKIPIISEAESLARNPNFYLIFAWGLLPSFIDKLHEFLNNGGGLIVPLPEPRVIHKNNEGQLISWNI